MNDDSLNSQIYNYHTYEIWYVVIHATTYAKSPANSFSLVDTGLAPEDMPTESQLEVELKSPHIQSCLIPSEAKPQEPPVASQAPQNSSFPCTE